MFKLTEEQMAEVIDLYGGDYDLIIEIERTLNKLAVIDNEDAYYEVICAVVSQIETLELKAKEDEKDAATQFFRQTDKQIIFVRPDHATLSSRLNCAVAIQADYVIGRH